MTDRRDTSGAGNAPDGDAPSRLSPSATSGPNVGAVPEGNRTSEIGDDLAGNRGPARSASGIPWLAVILLVIAAVVILGSLL